MEKQLFDWSTWDQFDTSGFVFYKVTLKVDIGPYLAGQKFKAASMNYENGKLDFYAKGDEETPTYSVKLGLNVITE